MHFFKNKYLILVILIALSGVATYARNRDWQNSVAIWEDVVQKSPRKARGYYNLGIYYRKQKQNVKALEQYSKAISLDPLHGKARVNRGNLYDDEGEPLRAILDYNEAIGINPEDGNAYYNRGVTYRKIGQYDQAATDYKRSCELGNAKGCEELQALRDKEHVRPVSTLGKKGLSGSTGSP